jgi:anti-sigma B factor antagonist
MIWVILTVVSVAIWGLADMLSKKGTEAEDPFSHVRFVICTGAAMLIFMPFFRAFSESGASFPQLLAQHPVFLLITLAYVISLLNIKKNIHETELTVVLKGRLDTTTAPELEKELKASLDGVTALIIDMTALDYISSAGLRVLLSAQKIMNKQGEMKVVHGGETIMEIFEVTGFSDILTIE